MNLWFDNRQSVALPPDIEEALQRAVTVTLAEEGVDEAVDLSLSFVTEEEIHALNADWRGVDRPTDVLSFPVDEGPEWPVRPLGDIVLCPAVAARQAEEIGQSMETELVYLTIHSVLHLLGYDHEQDDEKTAMREREKEILREVQHGTQEEGGDGF